MLHAPFLSLRFSISLSMQYKTDAKYGPMLTELHPLLIQPPVEYLGEGRPALLRATQRSTPIAFSASLTTHRYVFVSRSGRPYSASSWTQLVQGVFERETGRRISNNLLRDSFVTHVYAGDVSDRLKRGKIYSFQAITTVHLFLRFCPLFLDAPLSCKRIPTSLSV
jgi:hypothetical protein